MANVTELNAAAPEITNPKRGQARFQDHIVGPSRVACLLSDEDNTYNKGVCVYRRLSGDRVYRSQM